MAKKRNKIKLQQLAYGGKPIDLYTPEELQNDWQKDYQIAQIEGEKSALPYSMLGELALNAGMNMISKGTSMTSTPQQLMKDNPGLTLQQANDMLAKTNKMNGYAKNIGQYYQGAKALGNLGQSQGWFGYGGDVDNIPVEIEGKEVGETPYGDFFEANGPTHEEGGIKTSLPEGTEIYSNRIKIDNVSMADRKKKRKNKELTLEKLVESTQDALIKNSLNRIKQTNKIEEEADTKIQDYIGDIMNKRSELSQLSDTYAYGGDVGNYPDYDGPYKTIKLPDGSTMKVPDIKRTEATISEYIPQNGLDKIYSIVKRPLTAQRYLMTEGRIPDYFDKGPTTNPLDYAFDLINKPGTFLQAWDDIKEGNLTPAILTFLLGRAGKVISNQFSKILKNKKLMNELGKPFEDYFRKIEKSGKPLTNRQLKTLMGRTKNTDALSEFNNLLEKSAKKTKFSRFIPKKPGILRKSYYESLPDKFPTAAVINSYIHGLDKNNNIADTSKDIVTRKSYDNLRALKGDDLVLDNYTLPIDNHTNTPTSTNTQNNNIADTSKDIVTNGRKSKYTDFTPYRNEINSLFKDAFNVDLSKMSMQDREDYINGITSSTDRLHKDGIYGMAHYNNEKNAFDILRNNTKGVVNPIDWDRKIANNIALPDRLGNTSNPDSIDNSGNSDGNGFLNSLKAVGNSLMGDEGDFSAGDALGMFGAYKGMQDRLNTLKQMRGADKPHENYYKNFGLEGLKSFDENLNSADRNKLMAEQDLMRQFTTAQNRMRNGARSINTLRALDLANMAQQGIGINKINMATDNHKSQLLQQKRALQSQIDSMVIQGEALADMNNRKDSDNYYTQLDRTLAGQSEGLQQIGRYFNQNKRNRRDINNMDFLKNYLERNAVNTANVESAQRANNKLLQELLFKQQNANTINRNRVPKQNKNR